MVSESVLTVIRSWFCGHYFMMGRGSWRDSEDMLHAVCVKCGREYVAPCGLMLPYKRLLFSSEKTTFAYTDYAMSRATQEGNADD